VTSSTSKPHLVVDTGWPELKGEDGNDYLVIEMPNWFDLSLDMLINSDRTTKAKQEKIGAFLRWFAIKGFYAEAITAHFLHQRIDSLDASWPAALVDQSCDRCR